jgi:pimeloyl-ACP methyl ester carboxylesterase
MVEGAPEIRYAKMVDSGYVAYRTLGSGPPDVVFMSGFGSLAGDAVWELPAYTRYLRGLASFSRLLLFDMRGSGLSDPLGPSEQLTLERSAVDLLAVLDDVGCDRATLLANNLGGLFGIYFAASNPQRTASLVLDGCYARLARAPDYPWGVPNDVLERELARVPGGVDGSDPAANLFALAPTVVREDPEFVAAWRRVHRTVASPRAGLAMAEFTVYGDVRPALPSVQAPTLILYRSGDRFAGKPHARYLAEHIHDATLVDAHDGAVRRQLERFRGREVNTVGDGFVATFDGPGRAVECALAIRDAVHALGLEVRAGLHTGEIELRGNDIGGIGVHVAARVLGYAAGGEVVTSAAVPLLVIGSAVHFEDRGEHELKGVPGTWRLYAVAE